MFAEQGASVEAPRGERNRRASTLEVDVVECVGSEVLDVLRIYFLRFGRRW